MFYEITTRLFYALFRVLYHHQTIWEFDPKTLKNTPCIIAPNHLSFLDPPLVSAFWPYSLDFFAAHYLFEKQPLKYFLPKLHTHPITLGKELVTIRTALSLLQQRRSIVIFPEGSRSFSGRLQPLREGVALIALRAQCPIIPCYIHGTYQAWPRGTKKMKIFKKQTKCWFRKPLWPHHYATKEELTHALQSSLAEREHQLLTERETE